MPSIDPRIRRAYDRIAQNLEVANQRTQETLYAFTSTYISPCLSGFQSCIGSCTAATCCCFNEDDWRRRQRERARLRGRAEFSFDFYDDLEEGEADALLGLAAGGDEVVATSSAGGVDQQPSRQRERHMSYGTRQQTSSSHRSLGTTEDGTKNIPSSSYFGFLDKLPFKIGTKGFKYQPSIADLQEQPAIRRRRVEEEQEEPLLADEHSDDDSFQERRRSGRARSNTHTSRHTTDSLSSRGDIFPSEDEMDDAVPLDVEYALALERRTTGHTSDESVRSGNRLSAGRTSSQRSVNSMSSTKSAKQSQRQPASIQNYPSTEDKTTTKPSDIPYRPPSKNTSESASPLYTTSSAHSAPTPHARSPPVDAQTDPVTQAPSQQQHFVSPHISREDTVIDEPESTPSFNAASLPRF